MAPNYSPGTLRAVIATAMALALGCAMAWGQSDDAAADLRWGEKLNGNWCDAERGCTNWWTLYEVRVEKEQDLGKTYDRLAVRYRGTRFLIFDGKIEQPLGRWELDGKMLNKDGTPMVGKDGKPREFLAAIDSLAGAKEVIEGKIKGTLVAKIREIQLDAIRVQRSEEVKISDAKIDDATINKAELGGVQIIEPEPDGKTMKAKQVIAKKLEGANIAAKKFEAKGIESKKIEISIPLEIYDAKIEGSTKIKSTYETQPGPADALPGKPKPGEPGGAQPGPPPKAAAAGKPDEDDDDATPKRKIQISGKIKGKVKSKTGDEGEWEGDFEGLFSAIVQSGIKGTYTVVPRVCSEAGAPLSKQDFDDLLERRRWRFFATAPLSSDRMTPWNDARFRETRTKTIPGRYRTVSDKLALDKAEKGTADGMNYEAFAQATSAEPLPSVARPHTSGQFMRRVSGTVNVVEPYTITLELPALPVLDSKCAVIGELPKRTLKLVKQHDPVRPGKSNQ